MYRNYRTPARTDHWNSSHRNTNRSPSPPRNRGKKSAMIALDPDHLHAFLIAIPHLRTDFARRIFITSWMTFMNEKIQSRSFHQPFNMTASPFYESRIHTNLHTHLITIQIYNIFILITISSFEPRCLAFHRLSCSPLGFQPCFESRDFAKCYKLT